MHGRGRVRRAAGALDAVVVRGGAEGGKSWSFGCERAREDRESQLRCQMVQGAPQSGAHLRGRNAQRVLARALRRRGRGVNDVVLAGAGADEGSRPAA